MKKIPIFPKAKDDKKWGQFTINCHDETASIMEKIINGTSGLIRIDDLQAIAKILHKDLNDRHMIHAVFCDMGKMKSGHDWSELTCTKDTAEEAQQWASRFENTRAEKYVKL